MCGIYGCISHDAATKVLEGLRKLEYRGYDSAGLSAIFPDAEDSIETERTTGYVTDLVSKANGRFSGAKISIGHTRWATHGGVTDFNAHPHNNEDGSITLVHNGIIENSLHLSERITELGYTLSSETDTEVIVHLLDHELKTQPASKSNLDAFCTVMSQLEGSWAVAVMIAGMDGILVSRMGAPLVIGRGLGNISVSSDVQPFYGACSEVAYLVDGDNLLLTKEGISRNGANSSQLPEFEPLEGVYDEQDPGNFEHMMLKEIFEQPTSLSNVLSGRISADGLRAELSGFDLSPEEIKQLDRINLVACGTAYYSSEIISSYIRKFANVRSEAFIASEFPAKSVCSPNTLTIGISQSGETKDTLDAMFDAKKHRSHIASMTNVIGSTLSRFTGNGAYLHAGPEFAVASTKVFTNMIAAGLIFALTISDISKSEQKAIVHHFRKLPNLLTKQLISDDGSIDKAATLISDSEAPIFIGRGGLSTYVAKEGALKMMEISYLPCTSIPGGELKHGPIALITDGTPVIAIAPSDEKMTLMESSIRECKSRGAKIILISDSEGPITNLADILIQTNTTHPDLSPFVNILPLQLLAYKVGIMRGVNVDRPRNLAKSVTVV